MEAAEESLFCPHISTFSVKQISRLPEIKQKIQAITTGAILL